MIKRSFKNKRKKKISRIIQSKILFNQIIQSKIIQSKIIQSKIAHFNNLEKATPNTISTQNLKQINSAV